MKHLHKIAVIAAGALTLVLVPAVSANAETDTPEGVVVAIPVTSDEYAPIPSQSELDTDPAFHAYLQQEQQYQSTVETAPTVVSPDSGGGIAARTTNPIETRNDSVGALYFTGVVFSDRTCTANYIGGKFWLTAYHCVRKAMGAPGFIQQSDGQFAGIENIYAVNQPNVDLALIKVGSGISATPFSLSTRTPNSADTLSLVGYSGHANITHHFSSQSTFNYVGHVPTITLSEGSVFNDLTALDAIDYPACYGDSGGGYFSNGTMFGVHTGQSRSSESVNFPCDPRSFMANLTAYIPWIQNTMATKSQSNLLEIARAFTGGVGANLSLRDAGYAPNNGYVGS